MVLDRDAQHEAQATVTAIRQSRTNWHDSAPVVLACPPAGAKDFGETTRDAAWAAVWESLSQQV